MQLSCGIYRWFIHNWLQKVLGRRHHISGYSWLIWEDWGGVGLFSQRYPWWCCHMTPWRRPMLPSIWSSYGEVKFYCHIFQNSRRLYIIVKRLQLEILDITIGLFVGTFAWLQNKLLDVLVLHMYECVVINVSGMAIKENYLIVDRGGAASVGELGHGFEKPICINIPRWCVLDCLVQWNVEVEILGLLLGLVHSSGLNEALPIRSSKYK